VKPIAARHVFEDVGGRHRHLRYLGVGIGEKRLVRETIENSGERRGVDGGPLDRPDFHDAREDAMPDVRRDRCRDLLVEPLGIRLIEDALAVPCRAFGPTSLTSTVILLKFGGIASMASEKFPLFVGSR
jgi:hypothetical protein